MSDGPNEGEKSPLLAPTASASAPAMVPPGYQAAAAPAAAPPPGGLTQEQMFAMFMQMQSQQQTPAPEAASINVASSKPGKLSGMKMPTMKMPTMKMPSMKISGPSQESKDGVRSMAYRLCGTPGYQRVHEQKGADPQGPDEARLAWKDGRQHEVFGPKFSEIIAPESDRAMKAAQSSQSPPVPYRTINPDMLAEAGDDSNSTGHYTQKMIVPSETRNARLEYVNNTVTAWHENTKAKPVADVPLMEGEKVVQELPVTAFTNPSESMAALAEKRGHIVLTEMPNPADSQLKLRRLLFIGVSESASFKGEENVSNGKPFASTDYEPEAKFKKSKAWEYMSRQTTSHSFAALCIENEVSNVQATMLDAQMVESMMGPDKHVFDFCGHERFPKPAPCVIATWQNARIAMNILLPIIWITFAIMKGQKAAGESKDDEQTNDIFMYVSIAVAVMWLALLVYRCFAPLNASFVWSVEGDEKTIDRTAAHHSVIKLGTSEDEMAREHQYGVSVRSVAITHRDPLTGAGHQMFAMVSPSVSVAELFNFTSLAAPLNGLFIACQPATDPFIRGLSNGTLGGMAGQKTGSRYAAFINSVIADQQQRFQSNELAVIASASVSLFGRCFRVAASPFRKCGALCFRSKR